jgi:hypothetical protein
MGTGDSLNTACYELDYYKLFIVIVKLTSNRELQLTIVVNKFDCVEVRRSITLTLMLQENPRYLELK